MSDYKNECNAIGLPDLDDGDRDAAKHGQPKQTYLPDHAEIARLTREIQLGWKNESTHRTIMEPATDVIHVLSFDRRRGGVGVNKSR